MNVPPELIKTKSDEQAIKEGCYFDPKPPEKVRKFLETFCVQSKHPWTGKTLKLMPWQWDELIRPLYGMLRPDGTRRFKTGIIFAPKKIGKTCILSGLSLFHLFEYPGSEVYCIASDVGQADVLYSQAADMVELSPQLAKRLWVRRNIKTIQDDKAKSKFRVLSSTPEGKSGFSSNLICYDEIAEWQGCNARTIWDRLVNAGMARLNSLQLVISTANYCDPAHLGYELFRRAQAIIEGSIIDVSTLSLIYSLPEDEDWTDRSNWEKVCPSWNVTVKPETYEKEFAEAKHNPHSERRFRTFLLCQWVGSPETWIANDLWEQCKEEFNEADFYGCDAYVGLDMARKNDLAAYSLVIPQGEKYYVIPRYFMPRDLAWKKEQTDRVRYMDWERQGLITLTQGDTIDPRAIRASIKKDAERFNFIDCRNDSYGAEETRQALEEDGIEFVEAKQSYTVMGPPTAYFERLVIDRKLRHNGNPILTWNLANCVIKTDTQDRVMIDKKRATNRIDGVTSTILALIGVMVDEGSWDIPLGGLL